MIFNISFITLEQAVRIRNIEAEEPVKIADILLKLFMLGIHNISSNNVSDMQTIVVS